MIKKSAIIILTVLLSSCTQHTDYSGFWVEKQKEKDLLYIKKNKSHYVIETDKGKKFPAKLNEGILEGEVQHGRRFMLTIDENDELIVGGEEYIRVENSKSYEVTILVKCDLVDDNLEIKFKGLPLFILSKSKIKRNRDSGIWIEDDSGNIIPNKNNVGREFVIRWEENNITLKPIIKYLKLKE